MLTRYSVLLSFCWPEFCKKLPNMRTLLYVVLAEDILKLLRAVMIHAAFLTSDSHVFCFPLSSLFQTCKDPCEQRGEA